MSGKTRANITVPSHLWEQFKKQSGNASMELAEFMRSRVDEVDFTLEELEQELSSVEQQITQKENKIEEEQRRLNKLEDRRDYLALKIKEHKEQEEEQPDDERFWDDMCEAVFRKGKDSQDALKAWRKKYNNRFHASVSFSDFLGLFEEECVERGEDAGEVIPS